MNRFSRVVQRLISPPAMPSQAERIRKQKFVWSIGIYLGESPFDFRPPEDVVNPVLTSTDVSDRRAESVADPFMVRVDQTWYMFFEVLRENGKGEIGLAVSKDGLKWAYQQIVLAEPFHLSYPYVFSHMNDYYMIPESHEAGSVRLYKALRFPTKWSFVSALLQEGHFLDSSIFRYDDKWWLFVETNPQFRYDTLRLYCAENLLGPWMEHPKSPIIQGNAHVARPAGRVLAMEGRVVRYTQNCSPIYGTEVRAFEISELTSERYCEQEVSGRPILSASGAGWNGSGMHHIDPQLVGDRRWMACVDGWFSIEG